jgi:1-deoxy-D-xylulose-5-phosphate synthase
VGLAEEHAAVFAAGLAAAGLKPVVAIYASFMQRAMDYVFHDVCLQKLPVVFCLDRAGIVADGPTHHGIQDMGLWRSLPHLSVLQPMDADELDRMLRCLLQRGEPGIIRYPKSSAEPASEGETAELTWGRATVLREGTDVALWAVGREAARALPVVHRLEEQGCSCALVNPRFAMPLDEDLLRQQWDAGMSIVVLEDHCSEGGFGSLVRELLPGDKERLLCLGWPREPVPWGTADGIRRRYRLDTDSFAEDILAFCRPS